MKCPTCENDWPEKYGPTCPRCDTPLHGSPAPSCSLTDEILERIKPLTVDCPECESVWDDDQYQCVTCGVAGGHGKIYVLNWMQENLQIMSDREKRDSIHGLVGPCQPVEFENGLQVSLQEDGKLRIIASGRGLRSIVIHPSSDASCRIEAVGNLHRPNSPD